jgi:hypothetical protein
MPPCAQSVNGSQTEWLRYFRSRLIIFSQARACPEIHHTPQTLNQPRSQQPTAGENKLISLKRLIFNVVNLLKIIDGSLT